MQILLLLVSFRRDVWSHIMCLVDTHANLGHSELFRAKADKNSQISKQKKNINGLLVITSTFQIIPNHNQKTSIIMSQMEDSEQNLFASSQNQVDSNQSLEDLEAPNQSLVNSNQDQVPSNQSLVNSNQDLEASNQVLEDSKQNQGFMGMFTRWSVMALCALVVLLYFTACLLGSYGGVHVNLENEKLRNITTYNNTTRIFKIP